MKKIMIMLILISLLLASCGKIQQETPVKSETPSIVVLPTATHTAAISTLVSSKSPTKTPQSIDKDFPYSTHTPMPSQKCQEISIGGYSSLQGVQGIIPLIGTTYKFKDSYLLDLETGQKISLQNEQNEKLAYTNEATSPDGKWFAYLSEAKIENQILMIIDSKGFLEKRIDLTSILKPIDWIVLGGWIDNENLILVWAMDNSYGQILPDGAITVILNPFTGEWGEYNSDYPNMFTMYPDFSRCWGKYNLSLSVYNQPLDRVLYLSDDGVVLWDMLFQKQIIIFAEKPYLSNIQPVWSPDGESFVIDLDTESGRNLFLVSKDGEEKQITFMKGYKEKNINNFSWSPDGKSIAFWLFSKMEDQEPFYNYNLNILNLSTQGIKSYCITADNWTNSYPDRYPVWSPDGKYLIVSAQNETDAEKSMAVLVDLVNERAYKIADEVFPAGWMVSE